MYQLTRVREGELPETKDETANWCGFSNPQFTTRERGIYETIISDQLVSVVVFMRMRGVSVPGDGGPEAKCLAAWASVCCCGGYGSG
jgi:hypothetical protein